MISINYKINTFIIETCVIISYIVLFIYAIKTLLDAFSAFTLEK